MSEHFENTMKNLHIDEGNNDSSTIAREEGERKVFMQDLNRFMVENGKPLSKIPIMGYKELDLFQLFREVVAFGGFNEVVKNVGTWSKIWKRLSNFDPSITDSSFRLKKNYERYLLEYEYSAYPEHRKTANADYLTIDRSQKKSKVPESKEDKLVSKSPKSSKRKAYPSYKDIMREKNGQARLPIVLGGGDLIIENLGTIVQKYPFVTEKHIWPVGFTSCRYFSSMKNPEQRVKYLSEIVDAGDRPQFVVTAADEPENPIRSYSPSGAWRAVLKRILLKGGSEENKKNISVSGALRFGLANPLVSHLIRELPGANFVPSFSDSDSAPSSPGSPTHPVSPLPSPTSTRKRRSPEPFECETTITSTSTSPLKKSKSFDMQDCFSERDVQLISRQEMDDMETAVATLQALKYSNAMVF